MRSATAALLIDGQDSTPSALIIWTSFDSPPKVVVPSATLLAMMRSQPLRVNFAFAFSMTCSVSAAKPITTAGRGDGLLGDFRENIGIFDQAERRWTFRSLS